MDHPWQGEGDDKRSSKFFESAFERGLPEQRETGSADKRAHHSALRRDAHSHKNGFEQVQLIPASMKHLKFMLKSYLSWLAKALHVLISVYLI